MLNHLRERVMETLSTASSATLSTHGAAGIQANIVACEAAADSLYLLIPRTSDHLFNLEHNPEVVITTEAWQLRGVAGIMQGCPAGLALLGQPDAAWCELVVVHPTRLQIEPHGGLGHAETIDID